MFIWITREIPRRKLVQINLWNSIYNKFLSHNLPLQVVGNKFNISWVETKTRRQASLRHHPNASRAFSTNRKILRQTLNASRRSLVDKEERSLTAQTRESKCTNQRSWAEGAVFKSFEHRMQWGKTSGGWSASRDQGNPTSRQVFGRECYEIDRTKGSVGQVTERECRPQLMRETTVGKTQAKQETKHSTNRCFWTQMRELESCQIHQVNPIHMVGSISTKLLVFYLYQVKSRNFMQYMNQK